MRGGGRPPVRLIACGSALSVMSDLLTETKALYGRAMLNMCLGTFDHVETAEFTDGLRAAQARGEVVLVTLADMYRRNG